MPHISMSIDASGDATGEVSIASNSSLAQSLIAEAQGNWDPAYIHNDGSGKVDIWPSTGRGGTNYDLIQGTSANRPTYSATGSRGGGPACLLVAASSTYMLTTAFTLNQPCSQLWVAKSTTNAAGTIADGRGANTRRAYIIAAQSRIYAGTAEIQVGGFAADTWYAVGGVYSGASSVAFRSGATSVSGNAGAAAASGIAIGDMGTGLFDFFDGTIERGYFWTRVLSQNEISAVISFLGM